MNGFLTDGVRDSIAVFGVVATFWGLVRSGLIKVRRWRKQGQGSARVQVQKKPATPNQVPLRGSAAAIPNPDFWHLVGALSFLFAMGVCCSIVAAYFGETIPRFLYTLSTLVFLLSIFAELLLAEYMFLDAMQRGGLNGGCSALIVMTILAVGLGVGFSGRFRPFFLSLFGEQQQLDFQPLWLGHLIGMHGGVLAWGSLIFLFGIFVLGDE